MFNDLLADVPSADRPAPDQLVPPGFATLVGEKKLEGFEEADTKPVADAAQRVAWMQANSIDAENVICLEGLFLARRLEARLRQEAIGACNDWLANATQGGKGRLMPVTAIDMSDVGWSIEELTTMRARGSRSFLISGTPVDGIPANHSRFDPLWAAATDLGMVSLLHVGFTPARFDPGYAKTEGDMYALRQISLSQGHQAAQILLNAMVFGGVFERHPLLTLVMCELNVGWFPYTVEHMDSRIKGEVTLFTGSYPLPLLPSEYIRRNVRITPIPRAHQSPVQFFDDLGECFVFSSDYPHFEGSPEPMAFYEPLLADVESAQRRRFFGGNMAEAYERMGDALPV
jgi:predicted TIM-barrel fold metal-dependent hydrolase